MAVDRIIGVDFGTSTSVIRVKRYENGKPIGELLETKEVVFAGNGAMVPTLIMKKDDDASVCYYGYEAQQKKKKFTNYHTFKMNLENPDPGVQQQAKQLTSEFFSYLANQYTSQSEGGHLGNPDDRQRTIISYPVKWSEETKTFMLETAKNAGFPNVTGMDEAQAAIQAVVVMNTSYLERHGLLRNGQAANILLIDMGAGTTDLVLARYVHGTTPKTEVLSTWPKSGDIQFGGREIDDLLQNFFRDMLDEDDAQMVFRRIGSDKFKSWKEETVSPALSKRDSVCDFEVFDSCIELMGVELENYCLDRAAFEKCLRDYLKQFPKLVNDCLEDSGLTGRDIDLVIVTGGHSQWYFVGDMLLGKMPQFGTLDLPKLRENPARIIPISRPQETVALGLAYSGMQLQLSDRPSAAPEKQEKNTEDLLHVLNAVKEQKAEPPKQVPPPKKAEPPKKPTAEPAIPRKEPEEDFRMQFDPSDRPYRISSRDTVVVGNVVSGCVKIGDWVYVCGGSGESRRVQVTGITLHLDDKSVSTAQKGDCIAILLSGISAEVTGRCTHLSKVPQEAPVRERTPERSVRDDRWDRVREAANQAKNFVQEEVEKERERQKKVQQAAQKAEPAPLRPEDIPYTPEEEFELISRGEYYWIKKYIGKRKYVSIPPVIRGRKVVAIGDSAFGGPTLLHANPRLEAVVIPSTVRTINSRSFAACTNLHTVFAHPHIEEIGESAFWACDRLKKLDFGMGETPPGNVIFPPNLKKIGACAFQKVFAMTGDTYLREVLLSKRTVVKNPLGGKTFHPNCCAIFYYD